MNLPTILVSAALLLILAAIGRSALLAKKKGKPFCGCSASCGSCADSGCSSCGQAPKK